MSLSWTDLLDELNEFFKKLTRDKIFKKESEDFAAHVQNCLKLNKKEDWNYVLAAEDILEDSNEAIKHFLKFGLSGSNKYDELGEKYIRLYGLLSATYLQQNAMSSLYQSFQCQDLRSVKKTIDNTSIREVRNKLASHSVDYEDKASNSIHAYVPVRIQMKDFTVDYFEHTKNDYVTIDLKQAVLDHLKLMSELYYKIILKTANTIYKSNPEKVAEIEKKLSAYKKMLGGALITKLGSGDDWIIHNIVSAKDS